MKFVTHFLIWQVTICLPLHPPNLRSIQVYDVLSLQPLERRQKHKNQHGHRLAEGYNAAVTMNAAELLTNSLSPGASAFFIFLRVDGADIAFNPVKSLADASTGHRAA